MIPIRVAEQRRAEAAPAKRTLFFAPKRKPRGCRVGAAPSLDGPPSSLLDQRRTIDLSRCELWCNFLSGLMRTTENSHDSPIGPASTEFASRFAPKDEFEGRSS